MRVHRFYVPLHEPELRHDFWIHDARLLHQWLKVLRYQVGQQLILFDGVETERLYEIIALDMNGVHVRLVTDVERQLPRRDVYLFWSLLKKDKNDWVLQKATELGVSHFVPLLAARSEKTGFNSDRAQKIVIEAAEQCGRSDIPTIREPMLVKTALEHMAEKVQLYICEQGNDAPQLDESAAIGVLVGPEGGWDDAEKSLFTAHAVPHIGLGDFTLRAETASVAAATKLLAI